MSYVIPQQSALKTGTQSPLKVFAGPNRFDVTCLRLDDTFKNWVNTTYGTSWDGTLPGTLATNFWQVFFAAVSITVHVQGATPSAFVRIVQTSDSTSNSYQVSHNGTPVLIDLPLFGYYAYWGASPIDSGASGPVIVHGGPLSVNVIPCDLADPPAKLSFENVVSFNTPDGDVSFGSHIHIRSQISPIIKLRTTVSPWVWRGVYSFGKYDVELIVNQDGSDAWALMGCTVAGQPMGYAEFDLADVPAAPPSPVGVMGSGNSHGMDGLPAGITWTGGLTFNSTNYISVIGQ